MDTGRSLSSGRPTAGPVGRYDETSGPDPLGAADDWSPLLAFKDVTSPTNVRTMIATLGPAQSR